MPKNRLSSPYRLPWIGLAVTLLLAAPAAADWLITVEGQLIETQGPWEIDGKILIYTDLEGVEQSLPLAEVDLEASEETTAFKEGRPYEPRREASEPPSATPEPVTAAEADDEPSIILYQTSWCGYCRRARQLLKELDADFVVKDIERDREAAREYSEKAPGYRGIPLIDFDGEMLRGYDERTIRRMARELKRKQAEGG